MGDPNAGTCRCRPGRKCPNCEREEKREARHRAEERRVERPLEGDNE